MTIGTLYDVWDPICFFTYRTFLVDAVILDDLSFGWDIAEFTAYKCLSYFYKRCPALVTYTFVFGYIEQHFTYGESFETFFHSRFFLAL